MSKFEIMNETFAYDIRVGSYPHIGDRDASAYILSVKNFEVSITAVGDTANGKYLPISHLPDLIGALQEVVRREQLRTDENKEVRPESCKFRLKDEGKPYPRTGCDVDKCGGSFPPQKCLQGR